MTEEDEEEMPKPLQRCKWLGDPDAGKFSESKTLMLEYHDNEWCPQVVQNDDRYLFEMLTLSGAQSGLSWAVVLKKREAYRAAYAGWSIEEIAGFDLDIVEAMLSQSSGIIRNRRKILASISNAQRFLKLCENRSFLAYLLERLPSNLRKRFRRMDDPPVPAQSLASNAISKDLISHKFKYVGPIIIQAFLQSIGLIRGHDWSCHRHIRHKSETIMTSPNNFIKS